jgi:hypothetical protein
MRGRGGQVIYLDSSESSALVAQRRAAMRGLENIEFHCGSIEDLEPDTLGSFDYIHCAGVLHQSEDPALTLQRLIGTLKPEGGVGLVVKTPRAVDGAAALRRLVDLVVPADAPFQRRFQDALALVEAMPPEHPFFIDRDRETALRALTHDPSLLLEQVVGPPACGLTVPAVHGLAKACGLRVIDFVPSDDARPLFTLFYNPGFYVSDPALIRQFEELPAALRQETAELLHGAMGSHGVYLGREGNREATPTDEEMTPSLMLSPSAFKIANNRLTITDYDGRSYEFEATPSIQLMFHLIDGVKTIGEIVAEGNRMLQQVGLPPADLFATFVHLYSNLRNFGWVTLRAKSIPAFPRLDHLYYPAAGWIMPSGGVG